MSTLEIVLIAAALAIGVWNAVRIAGLKSELQRLSYTTESMQSSTRDARDAAEKALQVTRGHLAQVSAGQRLDAEMIREGAPFASISTADVQKRLESGESMFILDVRSPGEYARGHIRGSKLLPVDELERRWQELPQDKSTPIIVHCQSGGRSAAACDYLVTVGYSGLQNMAGGMGHWRGPVEQGSPLAR